tara:strand:+ start:537 stop:674 length:138 start_codon:yes stop_codon:yes gene_type:complete
MKFDLYKSSRGSGLEIFQDVTPWFLMVPSASLNDVKFGHEINLPE